jgi:hypothetical protein
MDLFYFDVFIRLMYSVYEYIRLIYDRRTDARYQHAVSRLSSAVRYNRNLEANDKIEGADPIKATRTVE